VLAYFVASFLASIAMSVVFMLTANGHATSLSGALGVFCGLSALFFGVTLAAALMPFLAVVHFARTHSIESGAYLVGCACVVGMLLCGLAAYVAASDLPEGDPEHISFATAYLRFLPTFFTGALVGGATYWKASTAADLVSISTNKRR
jgi:hypothetical protein